MSAFHARLGQEDGPAAARFYGLRGGGMECSAQEENMARGTNAHRDVLDAASHYGPGAYQRFHTSTHQVCSAMQYKECFRNIACILLQI
jgi:hypothetical protein